MKHRQEGKWQLKVIWEWQNGTGKKAKFADRPFCIRKALDSEKRAMEVSWEEHTHSLMRFVL